MSWTKEVTIWCDFVTGVTIHGNDQTCSEWFRVGEPTVSATRDEASDHGWTHTDGQDFCPNHGDQ